MSLNEAIAVSSESTAVLTVNNQPSPDGDYHYYVSVNEGVAYQNGDTGEWESTPAGGFNVSIQKGDMPAFSNEHYANEGELSTALEGLAASAMWVPFEQD